MLSDDDIVTALTDVLPLDESLEAYPGTWQEAPYADRDGRAVLGLGDHSWDVLVDRGSSRVEGVPEVAEPFLLNTSLERFVRCVLAAVAAFEEAGRLEVEDPDPDDLDGLGDLPDLAEQDGDDEDAVEEIGRRLVARLREIDPDAMADENGFWATLAEELGHQL